MIERARVGGNARCIGGGVVVAAAGFAALGAGFALDPREALASYLVAYAFAVTVALGALAMLMIAHAAGAGWAVSVRRPLEVVTMALPALAVLFAPIALRMADLYPWIARPELAGHKRAYLNAPFFVARGLTCLAVWSAVAWALWRWSRGSVDAIARARVLSAVALPAIGLTGTVAAFDWLMSLEPAWSSSMYGLYVLAGGFAGGLAAWILLVTGWRRAHILPDDVGAPHLHALGKLLLTAVILWAYVAYFQAMLIWIANVPREASWLVTRTRGGWGGVLVAVGALRFALPLAALLPRETKRRSGALAAIAAVVIAGHYLDVYWLVMPAIHADARVSWQPIAALAAVGGTVVAFCGRVSRGVEGAPGLDPRLAGSLAYGRPAHG